MKLNFALLAISAFLAVTASVLKAACTEPNENGVLCYSPNDGVLECRSLGEEHCANFRVYTIKNFPNGTQQADDTITSQDMADCWQSKRCYWSESLSICQTSQSPTPWVAKPKTYIPELPCSSGE